MAQPTQNQVHVDAILTNISVAYRQRSENFIAGKVFPVVPVDKQSDLYFVYDRGDWFRDEAKIRADATESVGSGYSLATAGYSAQVWAFHKDVGEQTRNNYDSPFDADRDATEFVIQRLLLRQEREWASTFFVNGVWGTSITPAAADRWNTYATSSPAIQIQDAKTAILTSTGYEPNTLVVGYKVHAALKNHPDIKEQFKYTSSDSVTNQMIAKWLEIDNYYVAKSIVNTGPEGGTDDFDFINGNHALLVYANPTPSLLTPSAGYTFMWKGVSQGLGATTSVVRIDMPLRKAVRIEGQVAFDNKLVAADMGYFINNAVV